MAHEAGALLEVSALSAGYGAARVLHDIELTVARGSTLAILGRNGVGKTTLVETLIGLTDLHAGSIRLKGEPIEHWPAHRRNRFGLGWVPQSREVFRSLTVEEHLTVVSRPGRWTPASVCQLFPRLRERGAHRGGQLSGGEQQMLAIARALVTNPEVLLLDEPVEGLAPVIVGQLMEAIAEMRRQGDLTVLLVEQKHDIALAHSDHCIVLDHGSIRWTGPSATLRDDAALLDRLLGVAH
ncbi:MAG TPA: ABC transporter ATP-binding protein [Burkholderiaceae bacterium]|nr:ABC transporter ATP-binding protein [Burkholderiaceae bacterium]